MQFTAIHWILFAMCAIIPALIVLVICNTQIQVLKGDNTRKLLELDNKCVKLDDKIVLIDTLNKNCTDACAEAHKATLRVQNLDESLGQLSNKLAARERDRKREENKRRKEEGEVPPMEYEEIPGTEQQQLFPFMEQHRQTDRIPPKRKFGSVPG
ncbi:MAG: hypothetical protein P8123_11530 [bacterium]